MRIRSKETILNTALSKVQDKLKEMFNILSHRRNANQNQFEVSSYTCQMPKNNNTMDRSTGEDVKQREHSIVGGSAKL